MATFSALALFAAAFAAAQSPTPVPTRLPTSVPTPATTATSAPCTSPCGNGCCTESQYCSTTGMMGACVDKVPQAVIESTLSPSEMQCASACDSQSKQCGMDSCTQDAACPCTEDDYAQAQANDDDQQQGPSEACKEWFETSPQASPCIQQAVSCMSACGINWIPTDDSAPPTLPPTPTPTRLPTSAPTPATTATSAPCTSPCGNGCCTESQYCSTTGMMGACVDKPASGCDEQYCRDMCLPFAHCRDPATATADCAQAPHDCGARCNGCPFAPPPPTSTSTQACANPCGNECCTESQYCSTTGMMGACVDKATTTPAPCTSPCGNECCTESQYCSTTGMMGACVDKAVEVAGAQLAVVATVSQPCMGYVYGSDDCSGESVLAAGSSGCSPGPHCGGCIGSSNSAISGGDSIAINCGTAGVSFKLYGGAMCGMFGGASIAQQQSDMQAGACVALKTASGQMKSLRISTATTDAATHQAVGSEQGGTTPTHAAGGSKGDVSYGVLAAACVGVAAVVAAVAAVVSVQQRRRASGAQGSRAPRADSMAPMTDNPGATMEDDKAANAL